MTHFRLMLCNAEDEILEQNEGENEVSLACRRYYEKGDKLVLTVDQKNIYVKLRLDDSLQESLIYLTGERFVFEIPFDEERKPYGKKAFTEERHWGYASLANAKELSNYRNLAQNSFDCRSNQSAFPHAVTNVATDNPQFYAQNAIDGIFETSNHGSWPHSSWGIARREDAWLKINFGRMVEAEEIILYLRADFPHDNWWKEVKVTLSNGNTRVYCLNKTGRGQRLPLGRQKISWLTLSDLKMSEEESPFPALSQIKVMGRDREMESVVTEERIQEKIK